MDTDILVRLQLAIANSSTELANDINKLAEQASKKAQGIKINANFDDALKGFDKNFEKIFKGKLSKINFGSEFKEFFETFSKTDDPDSFAAVLQKINDKAELLEKNFTAAQLAMFEGWDTGELDTFLKKVKKASDEIDELKKSTMIEGNKLFKFSDLSKFQSKASKQSIENALKGRKNISEDSFINAGIDSTKISKKELDDVQKYLKLLEYIKELEDKIKNSESPKNRKEADEQIDYARKLLTASEMLETSKKRIQSLIEKTGSSFQLPNISIPDEKEAKKKAMEWNSIVDSIIEEKERQLKYGSIEAGDKKDGFLTQLYQKSQQKLQKKQNEFQEAEQKNIEKRKKINEEKRKVIEESSEIDSEYYGDSESDLNNKSTGSINNSDQTDKSYSVTDVIDDSDITEAQLYAEALNKIGSEFDNIKKYAVTAEEAFERVLFYNKQLNRTDLKEGEFEEYAKDFAGFYNRLISLDEIGISDLINNLDENIISEAEEYLNEYEELFDIQELTNQQIEIVDEMRKRIVSLNEKKDKSSENKQQDLEQSSDSVVSFSDEISDAYEGSENLNKSIVDINDNLQVTTEELKNIANEIANIFSDAAYNFSESIRSELSLSNSEDALSGLRQALLNIVYQLKNELGNIVESTPSDLGKLLSKMMEADSLMRNSSSGEYERKLYFNSKTGQYSNPFVSGKNGEIASSLSEGLRNISSKLSEEITEIFDTTFHTHPIFQKLDNGSTIKGYGSDIMPSPEDFTEYFKSGMRYLAIGSNGLVSQIDFSELSDSIKNQIVEAYKKALKENPIEGKYVDSNGSEWKSASQGQKYRDLNYLTEERKNRLVDSINKVTKSKNGDSLIKQFNMSDLGINQEELEKPISSFERIYDILEKIVTLMDEIKNNGISSSFDTSEIEKSLNKLTDNLSSSSKEVESIYPLIKSLKSIIKLIKEKNELFQEEQKIVSTVIDSESRDLSKLNQLVDNMVGLLNDLISSFSGFKNIDFNNFNVDVEQFNLLSEKIKEIRVSLFECENISRVIDENASSVIDDKIESIKQLVMWADNMLSGISENTEDSVENIIYANRQLEKILSTYKEGISFNINKDNISEDIDYIREQIKDLSNETITININGISDLNLTTNVNKNTISRGTFDKDIENVSKAVKRIYDDTGEFLFKILKDIEQEEDDLVRYGFIENNERIGARKLTSWYDETAKAAEEFEELLISLKRLGLVDLDNRNNFRMLGNEGSLNGGSAIGKNASFIIRGRNDFGLDTPENSLKIHEIMSSAHEIGAKIAEGFNVTVLDNEKFLDVQGTSSGVNHRHADPTDIPLESFVRLFRDAQIGFDKGLSYDVAGDNILYDEVSKTFSLIDVALSDSVDEFSGILATSTVEMADRMSKSWAKYGDINLDDSELQELRDTMHEAISIVSSGNADEYLNNIENPKIENIVSQKLSDTNSILSNMMNLVNSILNELNNISSKNGNFNCENQLSGRKDLKNEEIIEFNDDYASKINNLKNNLSSLFDMIISYSSQIDSLSSILKSEYSTQDLIELTNAIKYDFELINIFKKDIVDILESSNIISFNDIFPELKQKIEEFVENINILIGETLESVKKIEFNIEPKNKSKISSGTTAQLEQEEARAEIQKTSQEIIEEQKAIGELEMAFRGLSGSMNGFISETDRGMTFFTDSPYLAREYADALGGVYQANLALGKSLNINGQGRDWNFIEYLGNGSDEASKKIIALRNTINSLQDQIQTNQNAINTGLDGMVEINRGDYSYMVQCYGAMGQEYESYIEAVEKGNLIELQEDKTVKQLMIDLYEAEKAYKSISDEKDNVYGTHTTNEFGEIAKGLGYDSVIFDNIKDSFDRLSRLTRVGIIFDESQVESCKIVNEELTKLINKLDKISGGDYNLPSYQPDKNGVLSNINPLQQVDEKQEQEKKKLIELTKEQIDWVEKLSDSEREESNILLNKDGSIKESNANYKRIQKAYNKRDSEEQNIDTSSSVEQLQQEESKFNKIQESAQKAVEGKESFVAANEKVQESARKSVEELQKEIDAFNNIESSAKNASSEKSNYSPIATKQNNNLNKNKGNSNTNNSKNDLSKINNSVASSYDELYKKAGRYYELYTKYLTGGQSSMLQKELDELNELTVEWSNAVGEIGKYEIAVNDTSESLTRATESRNRFFSGSSEIFRDYIRTFTSGASNSLNKIEDSKKNIQYIESYYRDVEALRTLIDELNKHPLNPVDDDEIEEIGKLMNLIDSLTKKIKSEASDNAFKLADKKTIAKDLEEVERFLNKNTAIPKRLKNELEELSVEFKNALSPNTQTTVEQLSELEFRLKSLRAEAEATGKTGDNFLNKITKRLFDFNSKFIAQYLSIQDFIRYIRQAANTVIELDTALVDLQKTSVMNNAELEDFYLESNKIAKSMGVTTQEIITQAAAWSRLGYNTKEQASMMAELSSQFASISPGMTTDTAQEGLVSIMKAFDLDVTQVESEIMDNINILGNNFAETNEDIVIGMEKSAATLNALGESYQNSFALFTGAQEVIQNAETVGTALKTLSLRIRGYDEETEELSDDVVEATGKVVDLTKTIENPNGISLFTDASQTEYKSIVDYLREISQIWDSLEAKNQTQLLENLFGKRGASVGSAILGNFDQVEEALRKMENSAGAADAEMEIIKNSIEYKINALKETWTGIFQDLLSRDDIKSIVDSATKASEGLGKTIDSLTPSLRIIMSIVGEFLELIGKLSDSLGGLTIPLGVAIGLSIRHSQVMKEEVREQVKNIAADTAETTSSSLNAGATELENKSIKEQIKERYLLGLAQGENIKDDMKETISSFTSKGLSSLKNKLSSILSSIVKGLKSIPTLLGKIVGFLKPILASPVAIATAIVGAIGIIIYKFGDLGKVVDKAQKKINDLFDSYKDGKSEIDELEGEIEKVNSKIDEINSKGKITLTDQEELNQLRLENLELERQIALKEKLNQENINKAVNEIRDNQKKSDLDLNNDLDFYNNQKKDLEETQNQLKKAENEYEKTIDEYNKIYEKYITDPSRKNKKALKEAEKAQKNALKNVNDWTEVLNLDQQDVDSGYSDLLDDIANYENNRQAIIEKAKGNINNLNKSDKDLFDTITKKLNEAYKSIYSDSEYNQFVIEPIFSSAGLEDTEDVLFEYFRKGGSLDEKKLSKILGNDVVTSLKDACKDAGYVWEDFLSWMQETSSKETYGFLSGAKSGISSEAKNYGNDQNKLRYYNSLTTDQKLKILELEIPDSVKYGTLKEFQDWLNENGMLTVELETEISLEDMKESVSGLNEELSTIESVISDISNISSEDYDKLINKSSKYAASLKVENGRLVANKTRLLTVAKARQRDTKETLRQTLSLKQQQWLQWSNNIKEYNGSLLESVQSKYSDIDALQAEIVQYQALLETMNECTNAFTNFTNAQSTSNQDMYDTAQSAYNVMFETLNGYAVGGEFDASNLAESFGKFNTDEFKEAAYLLFSDLDYKELLNAESMEEFQTITERALKSLEPLFDESNAKSASHLFEEVEKIIESGKDIPLNDQDWASRLGISEAVWQSAKQLGNLYDFNGYKVFEESYANPIANVYDKTIKLKEAADSLADAEKAASDGTDEWANKNLERAKLEYKQAQEAYSGVVDEYSSMIQNMYNEYKSIGTDLNFLEWATDEKKYNFDDVYAGYSALVQKTKDIEDDAYNTALKRANGNESAALKIKEEILAQNKEYQSLKQQVQELSGVEEERLNKLKKEGLKSEQADFDSSIKSLEKYKSKIEELQAHLKDLDPEVDSAEIEQTNAQINNLQDSLNQIKEPVKIKIEADLSTINQQLEALESKKQSATTTVNGKTVANSAAQSAIDFERQKLQEEKNSLLDIAKEYEITLSVDDKEVDESAEKVRNLSEEINDVTNKIHIVQFKDNASQSSINVQKLAQEIRGVEGTHNIDLKLNLNATGTVANAVSNVVSKVTNTKGKSKINGTAFAGGNIGSDKEYRNVMVGEVAPEMVIDPRNGEYTIYDSPTMLNKLPKDAIVFNGKQTEEILKNGKTSKYGKALANGTNNGSPYNTKVNTDRIGNITDVSENNKAIKSVKEATKAIDDATTAIDDNTETIESSTETIDLFTRRVTVLDNALNILKSGIEDVNGSLSKNQLVGKEIDIINEKINNYTDAVTMYGVKASEALSQIPEEYRKAVQDGAVQLIDETVLQSSANNDESKTLKELIDNYQEWADKVSDAQQQLATLKETRRQLELEKFKNIAQDYDDTNEILDNSKELINSQIELFKSAGQVIGEDFYGALIQNSESKISNLEKKQSALLQELNDGLTNGTIEKGSDEWTEMMNTISDCEKEIVNTKKDIEDFNTEIQNLHWETVDRIANKFSDVANELEFIVSLIGDADVALANGEWTSEGLSKLGLLEQEYETHTELAKQYAEQIDYLNQEFANGNYSATEYAEKLSDLKSKEQSEITSANSARKSILDVAKARVDIMVDAINEEIEAYTELINKKKDALTAEKDLHDYRKSIEEKTKNISSIEKQLAAMEGDNTAATIAKRKKLEAELAKAKEDLDETQYQHSVEKQQEALDKQLEDYNEIQNQKIEDLQDSLKDEDNVYYGALQAVKENTQTVANEINLIAQDNGYKISSTISDAWKTGEDAIAGYGETLSSETSSFVGELKVVTDEEWNLQNQANSTAQSVASVYTTSAQNLINDLQNSWTAENNANSMAQTLQNTLVNTLERGYNISSITTAMSGISNAASSAANSVNSLSSSLSSIGSGSSSSKSSGSGSSSSSHSYISQRQADGSYRIWDNTAKTYVSSNLYSQQAVNDALKKLNGKAKGGLITKRSAGSFDSLAKSIGEDHMIAVKDNEAVLTPEQTKGWLKIVDNIDSYNDMFNKLTRINPINIDGVQSNIGSGDINVTYDHLIEVQGDVNNSNINQIKNAVEMAVETQLKQLNTMLRKAGV